MNRQRAIVLLNQARERLAALGVSELYLYGSVARDEASPQSDVDLLIEPVSERFSIFQMPAVEDACTAILGVPAEVHDFGGYRRLPEFRARVGADLVRVF